MTSLNNGAQAVSSVVLINSIITNTPIKIVMARSATLSPPTSGSLILENVSFNNVLAAV